MRRCFIINTSSISFLQVVTDCTPSVKVLIQKLNLQQQLLALHRFCRIETDAPHPKLGERFFGSLGGKC